ncbi:MAG: type II toxin-antitoxin system HipA family toxin [Acidobacteria bacterium]|nr:type II toxin-antitoxin system HipA family toxin [Acidobacteriota bacterium]
MSNREIYVSISLGEENHLVGRLWCHYRKGRESASFEYDQSWLENKERFALEPALALTAGSFHTDQRIFGSLGDSAPDRWGRVLMRRAESQRARAVGETPRTLSEADFLLGVSDEARQGALRFSNDPDGPFLALQGDRPIPPLVDLPRLLSATERYLDEEENADDLRLLLVPGSSLGGARPKASIRDNDGQLAVAKFPYKHDENNLVVWEAVAFALAEKAALSIPAWRLLDISGSRVLLTRRFDRIQKTRIPFLSAMSMLQARDNDPRSYLEIADALRQYGAEPTADLAQLWRRIVFNILISNTDDHLRNHGFVYEREKGWRLSPAYDMNPTPVEIRPRILTTNIDLDSGTASLDLALSVIQEFRLSLDDGKAIIKEVASAVSQWQELAQENGLSRREIERMASAFQHGDANFAANL